jgi:hypothetical protein
MWRWSAGRRTVARVFAVQAELYVSAVAIAVQGYQVMIKLSRSHNFVPVQDLT